MTDPTPLSPAAQAVLDASKGVFWRPVIDVPTFHNKSIAAALRALVDPNLTMRWDWDGAVHVVDISTILGIAAELENHQ